MFLTCYAFLCGAFFAFLQFSYFFILESNISSAGLTYLVTTCAWILGAVFGLFIERKQSFFVDSFLTLGAALVFYILSFTVHRNPFDNSYLWFYTLLMVISGVYAGYFFNLNRTRFDQIKNLFFWENNGFIFGVFSSFVGMTFMGKNFLYIMIALFCALIVILQYHIGRMERMEEEFESVLNKFTIAK